MRERERRKKDKKTHVAITWKWTMGNKNHQLVWVFILYLFICKFRLIKCEIVKQNVFKIISYFIRISFFLPITALKADFLKRQCVLYNFRYVQRRHGFRLHCTWSSICSLFIAFHLASIKFFSWSIQSSSKACEKTQNWYLLVWRLQKKIDRSEKNLFCAFCHTNFVKSEFLLKISRDTRPVACRLAVSEMTKYQKYSIDGNARMERHKYGTYSSLSHLLTTSYFDIISQ